MVWQKITSRKINSWPSYPLGCDKKPFYRKVTFLPSQKAHQQNCQVTKSFSIHIQHYFPNFQDSSLVSFPLDSKFSKKNMIHSGNFRRLLFYTYGLLDVSSHLRKGKRNFTPAKINIAPEKLPKLNVERIVFQPPFFWGELHKKTRELDS